MSTQPKSYLSPDEYLANERRAEQKSEYFNGEIFAMAGASRRHNLLVFNLAAAVDRQLGNRQCEAYVNDMRVKVDKTGLYTYPDVSIVCDEPQFEDEELDTLLNPDVIIEVLSESTEDYDRGTKFEHYRSLTSLSDYLLVAQDRIQVVHYARQKDNTWLFSEYTSPSDTILIASINCEIALEEVYKKLSIKFE